MNLFTEPFEVSCKLVIPTNDPVLERKRLIDYFISRTAEMPTISSLGTYGQTVCQRAFEVARRSDIQYEVRVKMTAHIMVVNGFPKVNAQALSEQMCWMVEKLDILMNVRFLNQVELVRKAMNLFTSINYHCAENAEEKRKLAEQFIV